MLLLYPAWPFSTSYNTPLEIEKNELVCEREREGRPTLLLPWYGM